MRNTFLNRIHNWFLSIYSKENIESLPRLSKKTVIITLSVIIAVFYFHFLLYINYYHNPHFDDYTFFYNVGKMIEAGGLSKFASNYIDGVMGYTWTSLFTLILMPFYKTSYSFFSYANYINLIFGTLMIIVVYYVGKKLFNSNFIGITAALLMSLNATVLIQTSRVATENALILFSSIALLFFVKGLDNTKYWILAFFTAILAYMSKANGLIVILAFLITIIFVWKKLKYKYTSLILSVTIIIISVSVFNTAIEGNSSIFLDKSPSIYGNEYHGYLRKGRYDGISDIILNDTAEFTRRVIWGATKQLDKYGTSLLVSVPLTKYKDIFMISTGIPLFLFFLYLMLIDKNWKRKYLFLIFSILLFFSVIPRAAVNQTAVRYTIMATPIFYFYLAPIIYRFILFMKNKWNVSVKQLLVGTIIIAITTNSIIFFDSYSRLSLFPKFDENYQKSLDWVKENVKEDENIILETNTRLKFGWYADYRFGQLISTTTKKGKYIEDNKLIKYFKDNKVNYILIDADAVHVATKENVYFFAEHINKIDGSLYINKDTLPKELEVVFQDGKPAKRIIILKLKYEQI